MPGPYSSLMVLRRRASRTGPGRAVRGRKTRDSADGALIRLLTSNKAYRTRRVAARAVGTRDYVSSACSRRDRVLHTCPTIHGDGMVCVCICRLPASSLTRHAADAPARAAAAALFTECKRDCNASVDGIVTPPPCGGGFCACKASSLFTSSSFGTAARDRFRGSDGPS